MVTLSKFSNFPDELNENDKLIEYELSGSDCTVMELEHSIAELPHSFK